MVAWKNFFHESVHNAGGQLHSLLPTQSEHVTPPISSKEVTKIALRLKHQLEAVIPCELEEDAITTPLSTIITSKVIETAKQAGGKENRACIVYCLLVCKRWFTRQAFLELWDADLHELRAVACEVIAKRIIEAEEDQTYLLEEVLLQRYAIYVNDEESVSANVVERAVDLHALTVIGSSGYQKCITYIWRGWLVQDDEDPSRFVPYQDKTNTSYWAHLDPDRLRVPLYQNALEITFSLIFLGLYTGAINTINPTGDLDPVEGLLYIFTLGFICDEFAKFWKIGRYYISFWNMFNSTLYALLTVSFITRMIALGHPSGEERRQHFNELSYNFLAFTAPMIWMRLMLYLDTFRFFGTMLVVVKIMMQESLIFFALLAFVLVGFFQAFIGLDQVDNNITATNFIVSAMANAIMSSPEFDGFDNFAPPFGIILYYIFTFVVMVVLLNVLIALYNSAYEETTSHATDEYMALFAQKCLQFVRAPDENVYIAPFNLIELLCLIIPFEWWLSKAAYERLNDIVMGVIYAPLLAFTAAWEQRQARIVRAARRRGDVDEDTVEEWEEGEYKVEDDGAWCKTVQEACPDVRTDAATAEAKALRVEVDALRGMVQTLLDRK